MNSPTFKRDTCDAPTGKRSKCQRRLSPAATFCWQHAQGLRQKWHALSRNQSIIFFVGLIGIALTLLTWGFPDFWKPSTPSERPYVLPETAFWRNGHTEAVVIFKNSGSSPAYHNRTQIHFFYDN
jgi:hypothetical protein